MAHDTARTGDACPATNPGTVAVRCRRARSRILRGGSCCLGLLLTFGLGAAASSHQPGRDEDSLPAKKDGAAQRDESRPGKKAPAGPVEREAEALAFVQQHQPELARLLTYLRRHEPRQYQRAVRELSRTADRLAQTKERDAERYELELQVWKTRSRTDLLAAEYQTRPSDELRARLRTAVTEQLALQKRILIRERERVAQRLTKLDAQLNTWETQQQAEIARRMRVLTEGRRKRIATPPGKGQPEADDE